jgi:asparagine synthase (glutamine-hydrolysing)
VPPAHVVWWDRTGPHLDRYWHLEYEPKRAIDEREACDRIQALLREAVRQRLIAEVPLGALLSGGVDSSGVVAYMAGESDRPVKTFSIGFEHDAYNELPHARRVAARYGCDHREFVVKPQAVEVLPTLARHYGEPFADSSAIPSYYLAQLTRQHVTVALNGDGGDEAFAGYGWHRAAVIAERWRRAPRPLRLAAIGAARALARPSENRRSFASRADRFLRGVEGSRSERYRTWAGFYSEALKRQVIRPEARTSTVPGMVDRLFAEGAGLDALDAILAVDTAFYLPTDLLVKMDIATMANSLEARSPLLDHHLVEFVARVPGGLKLKHGQSKYLLKRALRGLVPDENLTRAKRGFAVPLAEWIRGELREFVSDHLLARRFAERGMFDQGAVAGMLGAHLQGRADYSHHLYILLMYELWSRACVDAGVSVSEPVAP